MRLLIENYATLYCLLSLEKQAFRAIQSESRYYSIFLSGCCLDMISVLPARIANRIEALEIEYIWIPVEKYFGGPLISMRQEQVSLFDCITSYEALIDPSGRHVEDLNYDRFCVKKGRLYCIIDMNGLYEKCTFQVFVLKRPPVHLQF